MLASITNLVFIVVVAVVNLAVGFVIAVLVRRGPFFSRHAPLHQAAVDPNSSDCLVPDVSDDQPTKNNVQETSDAAEEVETWVYSSDVDRDDNILKEFSARLEQIEQQLQQLIDATQAPNEQIANGNLEDCCERVTGMANQFEPMNAKLTDIRGSQKLPTEACDQVGRTIASLQASFQKSSVQLAQGDLPDEYPLQTLNGLLTTCQEARGVFHAVLVS